MGQMDSHLLAAWASGDSDAGQRLFKRHYRAVSMFFRNKVSEGVEDLLQQTFASCVESIGRLQEASSFRAFLFGIARNVLFQYFHTKYRRRSHEPLDFSEVSAIDLSPGPSSMHARHQQQRLILAALRSIPLDDQVILELRYWEEFNAAEIGELLGIPHPTARWRLRRARGRLQQSLEEQARSPDLLESTVSGLDRWAESLRERGPSQDGPRIRDN